MLKPSFAIPSRKNFVFASRRSRNAGEAVNISSTFNDAPVMLGASVWVFSTLKGYSGFEDPYPDYGKMARAARDASEALSSFRNQARFDLEEPIDTANGRRWLHTRKVPILQPDGKPLFLLGISEDITERKEAEEAREKWENVFRRAAWGVAITVDELGTIELHNPTFAAMHGFADDALARS